MPYAASRRAEFDWLRVVALGLMIVFHSALGFSSWPWLVSDTHRSVLLGKIVDFLWLWRVALVFVVSGAALMLALGRRSPAEIMRERLKRLAIPLAFGMVVIVPPQVYLERLQRGQFHGSYVDYLPHFADGIYPTGNLSWHHLWFIPYLLVLTAIALPLFTWAGTPARRRIFDPLMQVAIDRHLVWLMVVPLTVAHLSLRVQANDSHNVLFDGRGWMEFGTLFALGGMLARWPALLTAIQRQRYTALALGMMAYSAIRIEWPAASGNPATLPLDGALGWSFLSALNVLAWVLTVTGFVTRWLTRGSSALAYATEAALPVYILHQTLVVFAVYNLHDVDLPLGAKLFLTLSFSVLGSLALYAFVIRRSRWLGLLFGVKPSAAEAGRGQLAAGNQSLNAPGPPPVVFMGSPTAVASIEMGGRVSTDTPGR